MPFQITDPGIRVFRKTTSTSYDQLIHTDIYSAKRHSTAIFNPITLTMQPIHSHIQLSKHSSQDRVYTDATISLDSVYTVGHDPCLTLLVLRLGT